MILEGKTDTGLVRRSNQDAYTFCDLDGSAVFAAVCDGMGGANGGNVASNLAVKTLSDRITGNWRKKMEPKSIYNALMSAVSAANLTVFDKAAGDEQLSGMGTTVVAAVIFGDTAYVIHAGDSRAYKFSKSGLTQITRDHSIVQSMVESGRISQEEARVHPRKNVITKALGVDEYLDAEYNEIDLEDGEGLLLCSDGLTNYVADDAMLEILKGTKLSDCPEALIEAANKNGGGDNITAVICFKEKGEDK